VIISIEELVKQTAKAKKVLSQQMIDLRLYRVNDVRGIIVEF
jgi:hypothetical protein